MMAHKPPKELTPAIGYIRVSMLKEEQISLDVQKESITSYAQREGYKIVEWIDDLDKSGRNFDRRIQEAIAAVEKRTARAIILWKYSRFGRHRRDNHVHLDRLEDAGGRLLSSTEQCDARTAAGRLARGIQLEFSAYYSDLIGEQWGDAQKNRRNRGLPPMGRDRFGYERRGRLRHPLYPGQTIRAPEDGDERYVPSDTTGPVLAEAYQRYISGEGGLGIAAWLNAGGWYGTRGKPWSTTTILRYLDHGFGAGLLHVHDPGCDCTKPATCDRRALIRGAHDPVITSDEWDAYQRRRARVARTAPRARVSPYPLTGRIWCGHCGAAMSLKPYYGTPAHRYFCGSYLRKKSCAARSVLRLAAESAVLTQLTAWADDIGGRPEAAPQQPVAAAPDSAAAQEEEIDRLNRALDRLTHQLVMDLVPEDSYKRTRDKLLALRAEALTRLEQPTQQADRSPAQWVPVMRTLAEEWHTLPADTKRELVAEIIAGVRVFREGREVRLEIESVWGDVATARITR